MRATYLAVLNFYFFPLQIYVPCGGALMINKLPLSQNNPSSRKENNNICTENQPYIWCLPIDYKRDAAPWEYRHLTNTSLPWNYHFEFFITDFREINEKSQMIKLSLYFEVEWHEPRLRINESANEWKENEYVTISILDSSHFWYPDLDINGVFKSSRRMFMTDLSGILIKKKKLIRFSLKLELEFSCHMDFDKYPFDSQECHFLVASYYDDEKVVSCTSKYSYGANNTIIHDTKKALHHAIEISDLSSRYRTYLYNGHIYSTCGFTFLYTRSRIQLFFQVYLTSCILVIVSWTSFLINPQVVPGRMGLLVTLLLVLVNVFNGFKNSSPPSSNLNALDIYLMICIFYVFLAVMQYAIVLFLENFNIAIALVSCHKVCDENQSHHTNHIARNQKYDKRQDHQPMNTFDLTSFIVFPLLFISSLVIYSWIYI